MYSITPVQAMRLAGIAARRHGIMDPIQPLRTSANHVFRAGEVVVRVAPLGGRVQPGRAGEVVARLHRIAPARLKDVVALPFCGDAAWLAVEQNLALAEAANVVGADGLVVLRRECVALRNWQERARQEAPVVCHGDLHPQNFLMTGDDVVIIDWDAICVGPQAWDHAALTTWADRWGGAAKSCPDFARGYGADLRDSPLAKELAALRLFAPTINMIINAGSDPTLAAEARARMRYWLGDPAAPTWTPL
jgi:Ser/Thr protein kinase RdoA (MazF antagonist)